MFPLFTVWSLTIGERYGMLKSLARIVMNRFSNPRIRPSSSCVIFRCRCTAIVFSLLVVGGTLDLSAHEEHETLGHRGPTYEITTSARPAADAQRLVVRTLDDATGNLTTARATDSVSTVAHHSGRASWPEFRNRNSPQPGIKEKQ